MYSQCLSHCSFQLKCIQFDDYIPVQLSIRIDTLARVYMRQLMKMTNSSTSIERQFTIYFVARNEFSQTNNRNKELIGLFHNIYCCH